MTIVAAICLFGGCSEQQPNVTGDQRVNGNAHESPNMDARSDGGLRLLFIGPNGEVLQDVVFGNRNPLSEEKVWAVLGRLECEPDAQGVLCQAMWVAVSAGDIASPSVRCIDDLEALYESSRAFMRARSKVLMAEAIGDDVIIYQVNGDKLVFIGEFARQDNRWLQHLGERILCDMRLGREEYPFSNGRGFGEREWQLFRELLSGQAPASQATSDN